ncbi:hypothetical protein SLA2020_089690 [Shorea laevis]
MVCAKELVEATRALEYEKKANVEQAKEKLAMERNLISMAREIEKLHLKLMSADRRAQGLGDHAFYNGSPETRFSGGSFANGYLGSWEPYHNCGRHCC